MLNYFVDNCCTHEQQGPIPYYEDKKFKSVMYMDYSDLFWRQIFSSGVPHHWLGDSNTIDVYMGCCDTSALRKSNVNALTFYFIGYVLIQYIYLYDNMIYGYKSLAAGGDITLQLTFGSWRDLDWLCFW